jgi:uncharacterized membrane protein
MNENPESIQELFAKLDLLLKKQELISEEVNNLKDEILKLKTSRMPEPKIAEIPEEIPENPELIQQIPETPEPEKEYRYHVPQAAEPNSKTWDKTEATTEPSDQGFNLEKFIGENLISKIGIVITVIGAAIGVKYSIDHQLISPLMRVLLGYFLGIALLGTGISLRRKYENYSAVLISGAMTTFYFMTFAAFSFYQLISQATAFVMMVIFTVFTVLAAIKLNKQVVAHIGLVGAYAVPFLLGDDSSNAGILFGYMAIINAGILAISFLKYWKSLFYASFILTWLIFFTWFQAGYQVDLYYGMALSFTTLFFLLFYATFLAYKVRMKEEFGKDDVILLLANSFIYYAFNYAILKSNESGQLFLGTFTALNAVIHGLVSLFIYKQKARDLNLLHLILGLFIVFVTIAIPVQLNGNWVTLLWIGEAAVLFWIGRTRESKVYELLAYPLFLLAFLSLLNDWGTGYSYHPNKPLEKIIPLANIYFLTSALFVSVLGFMIKTDRANPYYPELHSRKELAVIFSKILPIILIFTVYLMFRLEIMSYFQQIYADSSTALKASGSVPVEYYQSDFIKFKSIWIHNYTLVFLLILGILNVRKLRNEELAYLNLALNTLAILVFLIEGLYLLSEFRDIYLGKLALHENFSKPLYIGIRYISLSFVGIMLIYSYRYVRQQFLKRDFRIDFDILLYIAVIWILSSELISWMDMAGSTQSYKLGLSILWGCYSLFLISLGIWKKKKYLRIGAITLFGLTLIKLFFYDIAHLDTISKTIVFVILGILLLAISFLYNKYRHIISEEV